MRRKTVKWVSVAVTILVVFSIMPHQLLAASNVSQYDVESFSVAFDGTTIETGRVGRVIVETITEGTKITTKIKYDKITEIIESDSQLPYFSITVNGEKTYYKRSDFINTELVSDKPISQDFHLLSWNSFYGQAYSNQLNGQKTRSLPWVPITIVARAFES